MSLCYNPTANTITVNIIKARNLKAMDIGGTSGKRIPSNKHARTCILPSLFCFLYTTHSHFHAGLDCLYLSSFYRPSGSSELICSLMHTIDLTASKTDSKPVSFPLLFTAHFDTMSDHCFTYTWPCHSAFITFYLFVMRRQGQ